MKRLPIALLVAFVAIAFLAAEESMLIDFTQLGADVVIDPNSQTPTDNEATLIDFSDVAGFTFSADELALMKTSLALGNWEVLLAPSARTVENENLSMAPCQAQVHQLLGDDDVIVGDVERPPLLQGPHHGVRGADDDISYLLPLGNCPRSCL